MKKRHSSDFDPILKQRLGPKSVIAPFWCRVIFQPYKRFLAPLAPLKSSPSSHYRDHEVWDDLIADRSKRELLDDVTELGKDDQNVQSVGQVVEIRQQLKLVGGSLQSSSPVCKDLDNLTW